ncbi:hypothetical protein CGMCC3_g14654 [Colletotrichum fructicola]|uniref:Uncharacterized protein n=1 Tax=Colletotrichum chrysophilum TaxID=1836956 RepID=A0AAD9AZA0_9PEZI|nr:uncharacterized protein CGMCC3_g14654 [Colletotrichum fructicola]KAE9569311.1 hypothetical protein CGMCC3_g14654 [Colletotrichum fructicola]KAK1855430.1 hypothetical protein CCHR01_01903 [Colletotrichum chrysophilum]
MKYISVLALFATLALAAPSSQQAEPELEARQGCVPDWSKGPFGGCP